jgi:hypothetical protein
MGDGDVYRIEVQLWLRVEDAAALADASQDAESLAMLGVPSPDELLSRTDASGHGAVPYGVMPLIETALRQGLPGADVYVEAMSANGPVNPSDPGYPGWKEGWRGPGPGGDGSAGDREPRTPLPGSGGAAAQAEVERP